MRDIPTMRKILVTGAAGFIGSNFVQFWAEHHPADKIVGLDALTYAGNLASLEPVAKHERFSFVDIRAGLSAVGSLMTVSSSASRGCVSTL